MVAGFSMQPSELAKIAFAIWGAHLLAARRMERASLREMLIPLVPAAVIALALIVAQPDLGQTVSLGIILLALLWYAGLPLRVFLSLAVARSSCRRACWRCPRATAPTGCGPGSTPGADPQDSGYQARQARYALANGGVFGDGLGQGTAKWNYLPNAHNDFIFAIIGEELGFVGAAGLLCLFGLFAYTGMRIARRSADPFLRLLTATATMWVLGQVFINVGYVVGLLPVTGLQLPLISAGGTSTATTLLMIGVIANAARHEPEAVAALRAGRDDRMNRLLRLPLPQPYAPTRTEALRDRLRSRRRQSGQDGQGRDEGHATAQAGRRPHASCGRSDAQRRHSTRQRYASQRNHGPAGSHTGRSALRVNDDDTISVVLAGGGTAGHVEPAMAVADALTALDPRFGSPRWALRAGWKPGWCPNAATDLELITPVPLPRKPTGDLLRLPLRVRRAVRQTRAVLDDVGADVVIGFGGYVALPAYLAARRRRVPVVIHEANASAGWANRVGARSARRILSAVPDPGLRRKTEVVGVPVRAAITSLDRKALRAEARAHFGFARRRAGAAGVRRVAGRAVDQPCRRAAAKDLAAAGISVLHAYGAKNTLDLREPADGDPPYVAVPYLNRMDLAYAAADLAICRSGAMTVAEVTAVGLPAVYVPLPIGNGEQRLNALPVVDAGGGLIVDDADLTPDFVADTVAGLLTDSARLQAMTAAAALAGHRDAAQRVAEVALDVARRVPAESALR